MGRVGRSFLVTAGLAVLAVGAAYLLTTVLPTNDQFKVLPILATLFIVGVTYYSSQITRMMSNHFGETREGEFRPYLALELERRGHSIYLVCRSFGRGAAADLEIRPLTPLRTRDVTDLGELPLFQQTIPYLAPGARFRVRLASDKDGPDLPDRIAFHLAYRDFYRPDRDFEERITLVPAILRGLHQDGDADQGGDAE